MTAPKSQLRQGEITVRRTTTISVEVAKALALQAKKRRVSVSWLIGLAIEEFVERSKGN
jgi:predicted transcriptional regulator